MFYAGNLYPWSYSGDVWAGTVTTIHGREITLAWTNKKGKSNPFHRRDRSLGGGTQRIFVGPPPQDLFGKKVEGRKVMVTTNYILSIRPKRR